MTEREEKIKALNKRLKKLGSDHDLGIDLSLEELKQTLKDRHYGMLSNAQEILVCRVWDILHPHEERVQVRGRHAQEEIDARIRQNTLAWANDNAPDEDGAGWMDICPGSEDKK